MYQLPDALIEELILAVEADPTMFPAGWVVRLYTAGPATPNKESVIGDFTELTNAQVPGYTSVPGAWVGIPVRKADGSWEDQGVGPLQYKATAPPPVAITVLGWYATDAAKTTLIGSGAFVTPFTFTLNGDGFDLEQVFNASQLTGNTYQLLLDMEQE